MEASPESTEEEFRALLAASQWTRAAEWLVDRYAREVLGLCAAMARDRSAAEDLAQDVFGRAFVALEGFRAEASSRTWLLAIARNRCIDYLRATHRDPWGGGGVDDHEPDLQPDDAPLPSDLILRRDEVEAALASLAEGERALVVLRYGHGLDYRELATAFGLKEGTARMRVSRALTKMRLALEEPAAAPASFSAAEDLSLGEVPRGPARAAPLSAQQAPRVPAARKSASLAGGPLPPASRTRAGVLSRLFGRRAEAPSGPPPHPLTLFFQATDAGVPALLRARLLESAGAV